jgi:multidrug efflux pump
MQLLRLLDQRAVAVRLVLAIGIVVDDAIVVVENVERNIEAGLSPARRHLPRHARGVRAHHRHRPGAGGGVRAAGLHHRPHRPVLQAVRADDRHLHGDLGLQLADPVAGAGRPAAQGPRRAQGLADPCRWTLVRRLLRGFNRFFKRGSERYGGGVTGVITGRKACHGLYAVLLGPPWAVPMWCPAASCRRRTSST